MGGHQVSRDPGLPTAHAGAAGSQLHAQGSQPAPTTQLNIVCDQPWSHQQIAPHSPFHGAPRSQRPSGFSCTGKLLSKEEEGAEVGTLDSPWFSSAFSHLHTRDMGSNLCCILAFFLHVTHLVSLPRVGVPAPAVCGGLGREAAKLVGAWRGEASWLSSWHFTQQQLWY